MAASTRRAPKKSVGKSERPRRPANQFQPGNDPRRGRGPAKGAPNAGRPPNEHVEFCRRMLSDRKCEAAVKVILADPGHAAFATMWREIARRGYGMPTQNVDVRGDVTHTHRQEWRVGDRMISWN